MVCLDPLTPDEFTLWYRHLGRLRLFWAKPVVELLPLYKIAEGCVLKARWASERPRLEEAYIAILKKMRRLDFLASLRGVKILITPEVVNRGLYEARGALYIYSTSRPCATGIYLEKPAGGHPEPGPDHVVIASSLSDAGYIVYLNRWSFNIDYMWLKNIEQLDDAVESAICEARRLGGRYVSVATGEGHLDTIDFMAYRPDYIYYTYKLAF
ncbi:hypothetical protein ODS41_01540 [Pyrobaculum sp. 3827-6]|uniref:hypothetical protein n=1 Tax=Pyrobaculum sp. 3827-6 TaxID=2983604 RepID=UPI0021DAAC6E|nr:hypothetical protein [Pyrobaculum sp. 3827-6]MCU7786612.1 hypothetical protein [Pyrobaculum sp. 3827-6]